jgi:signal transduction histidine kinase
VRTRIISVAVWASVLAIALFGVPLAVGVYQYAMQEERGELVRIARTVAIDVAGDVNDEDRIGAVELPRPLLVTIYTHDGVRLFGAGPPATAPELMHAFEGEVGISRDGEDLVVTVPVTHEDDVIGAVRIAAEQSAVPQQVGLVWLAMAALAALALAAAWLVGRQQARRLARPLEDLAVAARRLGDGDFSVRTKRGGIAEIDSVGSTVDHTAGRLDDLLARERAFAADASHQLRTPLAGLRMRLEAALESPGHDLGAAIAASLVDADRLESTIDELLALAHDRQARGTVDLHAVLDEMSTEWRGRLAMHGRNFDLDIEPGAPHPRVSTAAVRQVLAVLVDNATAHGAGSVAVTVREATDAVAIDVSDEGPGVHEPESILFERRADLRGGHGIGLALARRLAEAEGGRLELAQRTPPVFTLLLPQADTPVPRSESRAATNTAGRARLTHPIPAHTPRRRGASA